MMMMMMTNFRQGKIIMTVILF